MAAETGQDVALEIGHVLFIDIVGYSKRTIDEQRDAQGRLSGLVRGTEQFRTSDATGYLVSLPTGDGMALVFRDQIEAPARCAVQIARALRVHPEIGLRMGIHTGPVSEVTDVNQRTNVAGDGINIAQRVMDCGDAGHILLSKRVADDLNQYARWRGQLHDIGNVEVKHGVKVDIFNLAGDDVGNVALPHKIEKKRAEIAAQARRSRARRQMLAAAAGALALIAAFLSIFAYRTRKQLTELTAIPEQSVAVLPFENLSGDPNNRFLSVGIQDEIITRLSKIAALKVISRTSTAQYASRPSNLSAIAKELGVAAILEGNVQTAGDQIRVNVQLIKASTDAHLWAETYDRELINVLKVESDVAQEIAGALRAALTPLEKERIERKPTNNSQAYAFYLKAIEASTRAVATSAPLEEAQHFLEQAIALDPAFALAHARLSRVHTSIYAIYTPTEIHKRSSKAAAEEALRLQPDLSEGHAAMGAYLGRVENDYAAALQHYDIARKMSPNDGAVLRNTGAIHMRQGRFRQAISDYETAAALDPRDADSYDSLGNAYSCVQQWAAAERAKKRAAELTTQSLAGHFNEELSWAECYLELTGSFEKIDETLAKASTDPKDDPDGVMAAGRWSALMMQRKFGEATRAIENCPASIIETWNGPRVTKDFFLGITALVQGDMAKAKPLFESALQFARSELREMPDSASRHAQVGVLCAYLGQKEEAIVEGKRAVALLPVEKDAFLGPGMLSNLAEIYGRVGETEEAINLVEKLLVTPAGVSLADLKRDWTWDPLRDNPRFQKLINSPAPKVTYQ